MDIVRTKDLVYDYTRQNEDGEVTEVERALDGISCTVEKGAFLAVLGQNGSGKSTFAKHLNALLFPTGGTVWVDGMDTSEEEHLLTIRQTAGMVFQNPDNQIVASLVEEDVAFGPENMGVPLEELQNRVGECLSAVDMEGFRQKSPDNLSGGQKQRIAIAGVMAMRPKCIILDEPTAMLDPVGRREVLRTVHQLNRTEGITVILITHNMDETVDADRIFVIDQGKVVMEGTPREIFSRHRQLHDLALDVPQVTELAAGLSEAGIAVTGTVLTPEELIGQIGGMPHREARQDAGMIRTQDGQPDDREKDAGEVILSLKIVSFAYQPGTPMETKVLKDVDLDIRAGEFIGLIGHTGSGKSTLIQHMNGLLKAVSGDVLFHGESIYTDGYNLRKLRGRVGLVFQYPEHQLFDETVLKDVCFGPKNQGLSPEQAEVKARAALQLAALPEEYYDRSPFELSGGQKRRAAIAGVLAMEPEVLILDEPTAGLDPGGREEILATLADLQKKHGITVILVTHSMEDAARFADRLVVMKDGAILWNDTPESVFTHEEELAASGLSVPQVTLIGSKLRKRGWDIPAVLKSVEDAKKAILSALGKAEAAVQSSPEREPDQTDAGEERPC